MLDLGEAARTASPRLRSCLAVPLVHRDECIGVLTLYAATQDAFSEDHQRLAEAASAQAAEILATLQANETQGGIDNSRRSETKKSLGIVYVRSRDANGPAALLLTELEQYIRKQVHTNDAVLRPGRSEIVAVVEGADESAAIVTAARLQGKLEAFLERMPAEERVFIHIGVSSATDLPGNIDTAIRIARLRFAASDDADQTSPGSIH